MKKIFLVLAIAASLQAIDAQAQVKSPSAAKSAVEKAAAATTNPKQNTKTATWIKYGSALMDAYDATVGSVWVGMSGQELTLLSGSEKPQSQEVVEINGRQFTKMVYSTKNLYVNENGALEIIEVTNPVVEAPLAKAVEAYAKAAEFDAKGQKTKDIKEALTNISSKYYEEAYSAYGLGDVKGASELFEKAYNAKNTAPLSQIDTNALYNVAFTAWQVADNARAKKYFNECLAVGYAGEEGDVYAKLAEIEEKEGNKAESKNILEKGFEAYPSSQAILVGLINYYISSGEDTNRLFQLLDNAKKNEPNNASLYYVEGNIHRQLGNGEAAIAAYNKCSEINPEYEFGYIGAGIYYYELAVKLQQDADLEMDNTKYQALLGEFEVALKNCVEPFEKAFELSKDAEVKVSVAEYLKNACFRFRNESAEFQAKYDKYNAASQGN